MEDLKEQLVEAAREPKLGMIISTYSSVPYVHLQLENRKRLGITLPTMVTDDCSPHKELLKFLCEGYGVVFYSRKDRLGHTNGDLMSFVNAIDWGRRRELDYMVKISRRLLLTTPWVEDLTTLIKQTGFLPTYGRDEARCKFPLRTECVALNVKAWQKHRNTIAEDKKPGFAPGMGHKGKIAELYLGKLAYELGDVHLWPVLSEFKNRTKEGVIWHDADGWYPYYKLSTDFGLPYEPRDFQDVNGGQKHKY